MWTFRVEFEMMFYSRIVAMQSSVNSPAPHWFAGCGVPWKSRNRKCPSESRENGVDNSNRMTTKCLNFAISTSTGINSTVYPTNEIDRERKYIFYVNLFNPHGIVHMFHHHPWGDCRFSIANANVIFTLQLCVNCWRVFISETSNLISVRDVVGMCNS